MLFLEVFPKVCEADNLKKVENLAKMMHKHILTRSKDMKVGMKIRRNSILSREFHGQTRLRASVIKSPRIWNNMLTKL